MEKFASFKSLAEVKAQYGVSKLDLKKVKKEDSEYIVVMAGEQIIALTQASLDTAKPMTFGVNQEGKMRLVNYDPSKRVELETVATI